MLLGDVMERLGDISRTDGFLAPETSVEDGEEVIGILPDDLKPLWAVMKETMKKVEDLHERIRIRFEEVGGDLKTFSKEEKKAVVLEHVIAENEQELVHTCFWNSVRHAFPAHATESLIGLRKDWQVIVGRPKPRISPIAGIVGLALLADILGRD
ncbi:MAG: hypothetical protein WC412_07490 [Candidatus Omnitrophota bacterium]|jgi:hypothetical protein